MSDISSEKREAQRARINTIDFPNISDTELIDHFLSCQRESLEFNFDEKFMAPSGYGLYYPTKLIGSAMKGIPDDTIVEMFYHMIRNNRLPKFKKQFYPHYLKAFQQVLPDLLKDDFYRCRLPLNKAQLLFDATRESESEKAEQTSFEEYETIFGFITKAWSYTAYPYMRKKREKLAPYVANALLMSRIRKNIAASGEFDFTTAAMLVLLLLDQDQASKEALLNWHKQSPDRSLVWILGSFYRDFQNTPENKAVLANLYATFPADWIDQRED